MSRWIDADALKATIPNTHIDMFENCRNCRLLDAEEIITLIDEAPSIDIVRCKDCKKIETVTDKEGTCYYWCLIHGHATDEWRFCDYGERRE